MERISILGFILVILYFISTIVCNGPSHINNNIQYEQKALIDFKSGLNDPNNRLISWKGSNYCYWQGIKCENGTGFVISMDLHNPYARENHDEEWGTMELSGEISPSLMKLTYLKYLDLSFNSFNAMSIPHFFGSLKNLIYLNLSCAGFSGAIPSNIGNLSNLQYLDIASWYSIEYFNNLYVENIEWMTNLVSLKYLGANYVNLWMVGSQWIVVLNKLPILTELHLDGCNLFGSIPSPSFVNFTSLTVITISFNQLNSTFPEWLLNVSSLVSIDLRSNQLHGRIPFGLGELPSLQYLDLSQNYFLEGNISQLLRKSWEKIELLNFGRNDLHGSIPSSIGNFSNLKHLDLSDTKLNGSLPEIINGTETCNSKSPLPNLKELYLHGNQLVGKLPSWLSELKNLRRLELSGNKLEGPIPASLCALQHLESLLLSWNKLNGSLPYCMGQLSKLKELHVDYNKLSGTLSQQHFWKLSKLEILYLNSNYFHLNVSSNWDPPFQLRTLYMGSCHIGPAFPAWLQYQKNLKALDLSNANISSYIPNWFWNVSSNLHDLFLSQNKLRGSIPSLIGNFSNLVVLHLGSNLLRGTLTEQHFWKLTKLELLFVNSNSFRLNVSSNWVPPFQLRYLSMGSCQMGPVFPAWVQSQKNLLSLDLSNASILDSIPDFIGHLSSLVVINFSWNNLIGSIPFSLSNCSGLMVLDLGNNNLSGRIPKSLGQLQNLESLHLNHNKLSGQLSSSFKNLTRLNVLDLSYNKLSGQVPSWLGAGAAFANLIVLNLRSNLFSGRLPSKISNLSSLHVLDIAQNNLTGEIPATLAELKAMAQEHNVIIYPLHGVGSDSVYEELLVVITQGQKLEYTRTLSLVVGIDLSDNNLSGEFPHEITKLSGLVALNLSRNHITGRIPESISRLKELLSLDVSSNNLFGAIPSSMASMSFLGYLNLSNNKFSGKIPFTGHMTSFSESAYMGNPDLCGEPLTTKCQIEDPYEGQSVVSDKNNKDGYINQWFYLSVGLGFAMGILVPYFVLVIRKSWCEAYFDFVDDIVLRLLRGRATYAKNYPRRR